LFVPGDGLKRKRIVRTAEVTIETEERIVLGDAGVIGISFKGEAGKEQPHLCTQRKDELTKEVSEFKGARPGHVQIGKTLSPIREMTCRHVLSSD